MDSQSINIVRNKPLIFIKYKLQRYGYYENVRRYVFNKIEESYKKKEQEKPFEWTKNENNADGILYLIHHKQSRCKTERKWQSLKVYPRIIRFAVPVRIRDVSVEKASKWTDMIVKLITHKK